MSSTVIPPPETRRARLTIALRSHTVERVGRASSLQRVQRGIFGLSGFVLAIETVACGRGRSAPEPISGRDPYRLSRDAIDGAAPPGRNARRRNVRVSNPRWRTRRLRPVRHQEVPGRWCGSPAGHSRWAPSIPRPVLVPAAAIPTADAQPVHRVYRRRVLDGRDAGDQRGVRGLRPRDGLRHGRGAHAECRRSSRTRRARISSPDPWCSFHRRRPSCSTRSFAGGRT